MHVLIVGAGVVGLLSAVEAVLAGHRVTVVEHEGLPPTRAASHDHHRIVRALHPGRPDRTEGAVAALSRWREVEDILDASLRRDVGALSVLERTAATVGHHQLLQAGVDAELLEPGQLRERHPALTLPPRHWAVLEPTAGVVLASRALSAMISWLRRRRQVTLYAHCHVSRLVATDASSGAAVSTADGRLLRADAVVVAAGAWGRELLPRRLSERLELRRQSQLYLRPGVGDGAAVAARAQPGGLGARAVPTLPAVPVTGDVAGSWLLPALGSAPMTLSAAVACRAVTEVTSRTTAAAVLGRLQDVARDLFPGFERSWVEGARDTYYLEDPDAAGPQIVALDAATVALTACGGSAFKLAPLLARRLLAAIGALRSTQSSFAPPTAVLVQEVRS